MITSKLTSKAQTTIPRPVRVALHLEEGDELVYEIAQSRVILTKAKGTPQRSTIPLQPSKNGTAKPIEKPMASFKQGDVVRVPFPYTDRPVRRHRPALVVSKGEIGNEKTLLWVAMITSAENRAWPDDVAFGPSYSGAGLPAPSVVRPCKLATIEARHAERLGRIKAELMSEVATALRRLLGFD